MFDMLIAADTLAARHAVAAIEADGQNAADADDSCDEALGKNFVYHEIRAKLAQRGIPPEKIAFIQEHNTKAKRAALFAAMNRGDIRVLIASKQSTGMNIQKRLVALHNLDAPWRPGDLEQRVGRIERQGNEFPEVYVMNYVTEGSFDGYIWQTSETKARFIQQMRSGDVTIREIDDISEVVLSAAEIKAIASGNPLVMRKVQLDAEWIKLQSLESSYRDTQSRMRRSLDTFEWRREQLTERRARLAAAQDAIRPHTEKEKKDKAFRAAVVKSLLTNEAVAYTKREAAGQALRVVVGQAVEAAQNAKSAFVQTIGTYCGLLLRVRAYPFGSDPEVSLAMEIAGTIIPVLDAQINYGTDIGVFASIDKQIRAIPELLDKINADWAATDAEEAQTRAALKQPWDQIERYTQIRAELEVLNAALRAEKETPEPAATDPATATSDQPLTEANQGALTIVEVSEADAVEETRSFALPLLPPAALPMPSDPAAMARAIARLAAQDNADEETDEEAEAAVAVEAEAEVESEVVVAAEAEAAIETLPAAVMRSTLTLEQGDVLLPIRSTTTVRFGDLSQIKQAKTRKPAKQPPVATMLDLFAAESPAQMELW